MTAGKFPLLALAATLALLAANGLASYGSLATVSDNDSWVAHTHEVLAVLADMLSTLKDAETGQRGFLLTGQHVYLKPYDAARARVRDKLAELERLTSDNRSQHEKIADLSVLIDRRMAVLRRTVDLRKEGRPDEANRIVLAGEGMRLMDAVRLLCDQMEEEERRLLQLRAEQSRRSLALGRGSLVAATVLAACMVGLVFVLGRRHALAAQRAAAVFQAQGERFRVILASIGDAVVVTDEAGRISYMNPVAQALTGWPDDEARGRPLKAVFQVMEEGSRLPVEDPVARVLREGAAVGLADHAVLIARDGAERRIADSAAPIRHGDGPVQGVVLVFHDVSERREAEIALAESQARFRMVLEGLPQLVWTCLPDGRCDYLSPQWVAYTGIPEAQQLGFAWQEAVHPDDRAGLTERWQRAVAQGCPFDAEYRIRGASGEYRWFKTRGVLFAGRASPSG